MSDREQDRTHRVSNVPLALGVYLLSDNLSLRDSWRAVNDE